MIAWPKTTNWSNKMHDRIAVELGCFEKALFETKHPSRLKFVRMDYMGMQVYISQFERFRKTDSQHGRTWRVYRANLLTQTIKGNYDPVNL